MYVPAVVWEPYALAVIFGIVVSTAFYFVVMWPQAERRRSQSGYVAVLTPEGASAATPRPESESPEPAGAR